MWRCERCGRTFAQRNQTHTCRPLGQLDGHVVLAEELAGPRFRRVEVYSPRNVLHAFRLSDPSEVDAEVEDWLARAYAVGCGLHLS
ncbi:hypothetical protein GCM10009745_30630 [Kribbella yunnanensis]|uniref:DUF5655 domain-containing protein n=1 Tax=Kribbella yunnanensis TaxID=190194 RepID=A0ABN2H9D3_9ACTN